MNKREIEEAIKEEVAEWPGVECEFAQGGKHPKAKLSFGGLMLQHGYPGSTAHNDAIRISIGKLRRVLKKLGAERAAAPPSEAEEKKKWSPPNDGKAKRPEPPIEKARPKPGVADQLVEAGVATEEQAEKARTRKPPDRVAMIEKTGPSEEAQRIVAIAEAIEDGIYFGLSFEIYLEVPAVSSGDLQDLDVSPGTFWEGSWLDPSRNAVEDLDEDETNAQKLGKAYHCARLEPERFERDYLRQPEKDDWKGIEGVLWNSTEIGAKLAEMGETKKRAGESVGEQAQRLEDLGYPHPIWPLEEARFKESLGDRIALKGKDYDAVVLDMDRLRDDKRISKMLSGGAAEVSVFWTDENGIRRKARFDYLKPDLWADLKTFDNSRRVKLAQAITNAIRYNRYHITAAAYREAAEAIRTGGLQIIGDASELERDLIAQIQISPAELDCWFIFQEKKGIPNLIAKRFKFYAVPLSVQVQHAGATEEGIARVEEATRRRTGIFRRAVRDINQAKQDFVLYSQVYPPGKPWRLIDNVSDIDDLDFNERWLEGQYD